MLLISVNIYEDDQNMKVLFSNIIFSLSSSARGTIVIISFCGENNAFLNVIINERIQNGINVIFDVSFVMGFNVTTDVPFVI